MGPFLLGICLSVILAFSQIALLANVYDIKYTEKKLEYGLDDGSGRIKHLVGLPTIRMLSARSLNFGNSLFALHEHRKDFRISWHLHNRTHQDQSRCEGAS
ncbi:hypothetical protein Ac2012v2_001874 [Leucoagaricus gongylophorus]